MQSPITREHGPLDHTLLAVDGGADGVQVARRPPANHFFHFDGALELSNKIINIQIQSTVLQFFSIL